MGVLALGQRGVPGVVQGCAVCLLADLAECLPRAGGRAAVMLLQIGFVASQINVLAYARVLVFIQIGPLAPVVISIAAVILTALYALCQCHAGGRAAGVRFGFLLPADAGALVVAVVHFRPVAVAVRRLILPLGAAGAGVIMGVLALGQGGGPIVAQGLGIPPDELSAAGPVAILAFRAAVQAGGGGVAVLHLPAVVVQDMVSARDLQLFQRHRFPVALPLEQQAASGALIVRLVPVRFAGGSLAGHGFIGMVVEVGIAGFQSVQRDIRVLTSVIDAFKQLAAETAFPVRFDHGLCAGSGLHFLICQLMLIVAVFLIAPFAFRPGRAGGRTAVMLFKFIIGVTH